jgi:hypothetical protein
MATTSSSKKRVEKGVHKGNYDDCQHSDKFDLSVQVSGNGKTAVGRRPGMSEDDDAMIDEGDDDDDDMYPRQQSTMQTTLLGHITLPGWCSTAQ